MSDLLEIDETLERLNSSLLDLMIRGLRVCGPEHLNSLKAIHKHLHDVGAKYLSGRLQKLIAAIEADAPNAASELMETQAAMRVFERILTLRFADSTLSSQQEAPDEEFTEDDE